MIRSQCFLPKRAFILEKKLSYQIINFIVNAKLAGNISADNVLKYFPSLIKNRFDISCKFSSIQEMSNPIFLEKYYKYINVSSAKSAQSIS